MSPLRSRRRARRRSRSGKVVVLVVLGVIVALLVGGVTQVGRQSGPYDARVNRSFATQGAVVANDSNVTAASVRRLMKDMPNLDRRTLQAELDSFTAQSAGQAARAEFLATPAPPGGVQEQFAAVFADRAQAVHELRAAIDGLLGMHPLQVAGAAPSTGTATATPTLLSSTQATNRIAAVGGLLARSDRSYAAVRRSLARLPGHARLPASKWIASADTWQVGAVGTQVDLVATSTSLAVTHRLALSVVQITPPALPSPTGVATPGSSMLSPTTEVDLHVVLSNLGSVDEPHASVRFTLVPQPSGATATLTRRAAVAAGGSVSLAPASFPVKPGVSYQLTVAIKVPAGQTDVVGTALGELLEIAPTK
jgi:hypothetical protein